MDYELLEIMSRSRTVANEDSRGVLADETPAYSCQGSDLNAASAAREARERFEKWRNSDFLKFAHRSDVFDRYQYQFGMDWHCNNPEEFVSPQSSLSALNDNWYKEDHHQLRMVETEQPIVSLEAFSLEAWEIEADEEVQLPRQFLPQGLDWDYQFQETDYGTDVEVVSESEQSIDTMLGGSEAISQKRILNKLMSSIYSSPSHSSVPSGREVPSRVVSAAQTTASWRMVDKDRDKKKRVMVQSTRVSDTFVQVMDDIKDRARNITSKQVQLLTAQRRMNEQIRKLSPGSDVDSWDVDDPEAIEVMRRGTLQGFGLTRRSTTADMGGKLLALKRVTRELATLDLRRHIALSDRDLGGFCYHNHNNTRDLVLQGREVFRRTGRRIQDFDLPYIFTFLLANRDIVNLDLSYNEVTNTGAWYIMDFLSWNTTLLSLNLMNNEIDALDSHMIDKLCENTTLKSLRLNGNPLGKKGGEYIAFLLMFKDLEHLDLGQTDQTVESLAWISQALIQSSNLKVLDLSRVLGYQGYICDTLHFAIAFSDILRFCESLEEVHLGKNGLSDVDLEQLLFGFSFNKRLELLDLSCNRIGNHGAEMIADALHCGAPLKAIILNTNRIGDVGARALSLKLPMSQIKFLDVSTNRMTDQGIVDIVNTIRKPYPLLALFIFGNKINTHALEVIQNLILTGDLNPESMDITIFYWEGNIGHGHNAAADRYRPRYYRVAASTKTEKSTRRGKAVEPCRPGCLDYKYHNAVNVRFRQPVPSNSLGPSCPA